MTTSSRPARLVPALAALAMALVALGTAGGQWLGAREASLQAQRPELDTPTSIVRGPGEGDPTRQPVACKDCVAFPLTERSL